MNKQHMPFWAQDQLASISITRLMWKKCLHGSNVFIWPYWFEDSDGHLVTVNTTIHWTDEKKVHPGAKADVRSGQWSWILWFLSMVEQHCIAPMLYLNTPTINSLDAGSSPIVQTFLACLHSAHCEDLSPFVYFVWG